MENGVIVEEQDFLTTGPVDPTWDKLTSMQGRLIRNPAVPVPSTYIAGPSMRGEPWLGGRFWRDKSFKCLISSKTHYLKQLAAMMLVQGSDHPNYLQRSMLMECKDSTQY